MNTNPDAKVVLCFGDSNAYGTMPGKEGGRYPSNVRWPGKLQDLLGNDYYIIEEGLGGRATNLEHPNPKKSSRNGLEYFKPCFDSHLLVDIVIIMLGTNDLKIRYDRTPQDIIGALEKYITAIHEITSDRNIKYPQIILISPPYMDDAAPGFIEELNSGQGMYDKESVNKSKQLAEPIKALADKFGCEFLDVGPITKVGGDGAHLTRESHIIIAESLVDIINKLIV